MSTMIIIHKKRLVDCRKLWTTCLSLALTKLVSFCDGISSGMGSLLVDETFLDENVDLPINTFVVDLTTYDDFGCDLGAIRKI